MQESEDSNQDHRLANYYGEIKNDRMEGEGIYWFDTNTRYEGGFRNGAFHGKGTLFFPGGGRYESMWDNGREVSGNYVFQDGLNFENDDDPLTGWRFCSRTWDRRFYKEITEGLRPADRCITSANCDEGGKPLRSIPEDCYDTGDGYYDPTQRVIYRYDEDAAKALLQGERLNSFLRNVTEEEHDWIIQKCREGRDGFVGCQRKEDYDDIKALSESIGRLAASKNGTFSKKFPAIKKQPKSILAKTSPGTSGEVKSSGRRKSVTWN
ncbi:MORN repeat-containing protein 5-like [Clavelina lepadiformis]|uniref:MORN repeat-containing protein 5-like n=1 Tax=Clavelina lepadiformis TaxID=159417 RepID=UPI004042C5BB